MPSLLVAELCFVFVFSVNLFFLSKKEFYLPEKIFLKNSR